MRNAYKTLVEGDDFEGFDIKYVMNKQSSNYS